MSGIENASPWYHLGALSMAVAMTLKNKDPNEGRQALKDYMASEAITQEHRDRLKKELKK